MYQHAEFVAITDKGLQVASPAIQEYVREFFRHTHVLGKDAWVAFIGSVRMFDNGGAHKNRGVAISNWRGNLSDEIDAFAKAHPSDAFRFSVGWDDGCVGPEPD